MSCSWANVTSSTLSSRPRPFTFDINLFIVTRLLHHSMACRVKNTNWYYNSKKIINNIRGLKIMSHQCSCALANCSPYSWSHDFPLQKSYQCWKGLLRWMIKFKSELTYCTLNLTLPSSCKNKICVFTTKLEKAILSTKVKVKVSRSLTLVSIQKGIIIWVCMPNMFASHSLMVQKL